jgi:osmotically inducible protein OsmC
LLLHGPVRRLGPRWHAAQKLEVRARVTLDRVEGGWRVVSSALTLRGLMPGIDEAAFKEAAEAAKDDCPVSQTIKGNVAPSVEATLEK